MCDVRQFKIIFLKSDSVSPGIYFAYYLAILLPSFKSKGFIMLMPNINMKLDIP